MPFRGNRADMDSLFFMLRYPPSFIRSRRLNYILFMRFFCVRECYTVTALHVLLLYVSSSLYQFHNIDFPVSSTSFNNPNTSPGNCILFDQRFQSLQQSHILTYFDIVNPQEPTTLFSPRTFNVCSYSRRRLFTRFVLAHCVPA